jgi:hypothetical protein
VRRIQEVIIDPAVSLDGALAGEGGAALQGEAQLIASNAAEDLDGAATPAMLESAQLGEGGEGDGGGTSQLNGPSTHSRHKDDVGSGASPPGCCAGGAKSTYERPPAPAPAVGAPGDASAFEVWRAGAKCTNERGSR